MSDSDKKHLANLREQISLVNASPDKEHLASIMTIHDRWEEHGMDHNISFREFLEELTAMIHDPSIEDPDADVDPAVVVQRIMQRR
jgi:hypothetical protein